MIAWIYSHIVRSVTPQLVSSHNWSGGPSAANYVAIDGPPGPSMAAMDGPLCRKWSPTSKQAQGGENRFWNTDRTK